MASMTWFRPTSGIKALLDQVYAIKFSKHVPLVMILLFAVFAVWRTNNYVAHQMSVSWLVSGSLAICIELAMIAAGAACFISMREAYIRELKQEDAERARLGVYISFAMLGVTTLALMVLAGADGHMESGGNIAFVLLMLLIQFVQSCAILIFINVADLDEREKLREQFRQNHQKNIQQKASECPYCHKHVAPNNRARHMNSCPMKP